jgi:methylated-DNA-[protein]-cysteine S-methyltransferase
VTTYKHLAHFIRCKSSQAIGQALTQNHNAPEIPCHRVIKTNGNIGGYAFGIEKKREILASE